MKPGERISPSEILPYSVFKATFDPVEPELLHPEVVAWTGRTIEWEARYRLQVEPYVGEWAVEPQDIAFPADEVPSRDLRWPT